MYTEALLDFDMFACSLVCTTMFICSMILVHFNESGAIGAHSPEHAGLGWFANTMARPHVASKFAAKLAKKKKKKKSCGCQWVPPVAPYAAGARFV